MKKKTKMMLVVILLLGVGVVVLFSLRGQGYRGKLISLYKTMITDPVIDLEQYPAFTGNAKDWFQQNTIIVHGLGKIGENFTTNSKEAFEYSYEKGNRVFETDISLTSDGKAVLSHEFDGFVSEQEVPTYAEFMRGKVEGKYTTLSLEWIVDTLIAKEDLYLMTDCKADSLASICKQIVAQAKEQGREDILTRLIIQVYSEEDIISVQQVYPFANILYSTYKSGYLSQKEIAEICLKYKIPVVTQGAMKSREKDIRYFKEKNIKAFAFTVNTEELEKELKEVGYQGVYSDVLVQ